MVSKRLARMEARLGAQLLRRSTRRMMLTDAGARFHDEVVAILAAAEAAEARLSGRTRAPGGSLTITAPTSFGRVHVAPVVAHFVRLYPQVAVRLDLSDAFTDLLANRVDLAIRITGTVPPSLVAERIADSRRVLCAAPAYLRDRGTPARVADLARHDLLAADGQLPWRLAGTAGARMVRGTSLVATDSSEMVRELALAGLGIALRSLWDVDADLAAGRLVRILPELAGSADVGIYAVRPPGAQVAAAVEAFIAALRDAFGPLPPWERG